MSMDHRHPTSFFILDNEELGTFWIGQTKMRLDANGRSLLPHISRDQLVDKLATKYEEYSYPCLEVERVKKDGTYLFYGLEQWITKLNCEIKRNPRKLRDVNELLTAGWIEGDPTINSTVHVLHINNTKEVVQKVYRKLLGEWEAKGLRCLNTLRCKTDKEKYEHKKKDPNFMYNKARKEVLRQMKNTGKIPKDATIEKYQIKDEEIKECMGQKEFYKKNGKWHCFCNKRTEDCHNIECKNEGLKLGLKVGGKMCEHNRRPSKCRACGGGSFCHHNKLRSVCKECGGGSICEHKRVRSACKECGGGSICEHDRVRSTCKLCGGGSICEHNKRRSVCKKCNGGSICKHDKERSICKLCFGTKICPHNKRIRTCKICNPHGHIAELRRSRRWHVTNFKNVTHTLDDLCMTSEEWLKYLHKTFEDRYGRPKTEEDDVHIDEIIPCSAWNLPDDNKYCWHYLNSQWLLAEDNLSKGDSYNEEDKLAMIEVISSELSQPCSSSLE
jgi:hypothetical protein